MFAYLVVYMYNDSRGGIAYGNIPFICENVQALIKGINIIIGAIKDQLRKQNIAAKNILIANLIQLSDKEDDETDWTIL